MFGRLTYLVFEVAWAVPVLGIQWTVGWRPLWRRRALLLSIVLLTALYLSAADSVAIAQGIWTLHPDRITGLRLGNVPIEETIFFLLTNAMVVQSILLVRYFISRRKSNNSPEKGC